MSYEMFVEREMAEADDIDLYTRIHILASDLTDDDAKKAAIGRHHQLVHRYAQYAEQAMSQIKALGLARPEPGILEALGRGSYLIVFTFQMARPLLSRDDEPLFICDNPMRKDTVFRVPMMSPTAWKGCLRSAAVRLLAQKAGRIPESDFASARLRLTALFGSEKGVDVEEPDPHLPWQGYLDQVGGAAAGALYRTMVKGHSATGFLAGRLRFFPTFFDRLSVEVINPHDRTKKAGKLPIYFECVPDGSAGPFALLYVPFDLAGQPVSELRLRVADDLEVIAPALSAMLALYGFGAKTSSGYGVIKKGLIGQGTLVMNLEERDVAATQPVLSQAPRSPDEVRDFLVQHPEEDFSLSVREWRKKHGVGKGLARQYRLARDAFRRHQQELDRYQAEQTDQSARTERPPTGITRTFTTLGELEATLVELASSLRQEENHE